MNAYIIDAIRTPRGRGNDKSSLKEIAPIDLLAQLFNAMQQRNRLDPAVVEDAVIGCVSQAAEQGQNVGRLALLAAGWSDTTPAATINRYCASGLTATNFAAMQAVNADGITVGGGVEMMSRVPMGSDKGPLTNDYAFQKMQRLIPLGLSADTVASLYGYSREACDEYACDSQLRATRARSNGWFTSLVPVQRADGTVALEQDETIRAGTTLETLAGMTPSFAELGAKGFDAALCVRFRLPALRHVHHAGNSPAVADGASLVLLASEAAIARHGLRARARIVATADAGADRTLAMTGAADATRKVLRKSGLTLDQIDLFEVNEAFAALMLQYMREIPVEHERLNVNGGAIALGHAMGSTGAALVGTLLDELERRNGRYGLVAISGAAGVATATIIECLHRSNHRHSRLRGNDSDFG